MAATAVPNIAQLLLHPQTTQHAMVLDLQLTRAAHQIPDVLLRRTLQPEGWAQESTRLSVTLPNPSSQIRC